MPTEEHYGLICLAVANDDPEQAERIYQTWRWADVRRYAALQYARRWSPKKERETPEEKEPGGEEE